MNTDITDIVNMSEIHIEFECRKIAIDRWIK